MRPKLDNWKFEFFSQKIKFPSFVVSCVEFSNGLQLNSERSVLDTFKPESLWFHCIQFVNVIFAVNKLLNWWFEQIQHFWCIRNSICSSISAVQFTKSRLVAAHQLIVASRLANNNVFDFQQIPWCPSISNVIHSTYYVIQKKFFKFNEIDCILMNFRFSEMVVHSLCLFSLLRIEDFACSCFIQILVWHVFHAV